MSSSWIQQSTKLVWLFLHFCVHVCGWMRGGGGAGVGIMIKTKICQFGEGEGLQVGPYMQ